MIENAVAIFLANFALTMALQVFLIWALKSNDYNLWVSIGSPKPINVFGKDGKVAAKFAWTKDGKYIILKYALRVTRIFHYMLFLGIIIYQLMRRHGSI